MGLDIGSRTVTVAVCGGRGSNEVLNYGQAELPENAVIDGEVRDPEAVASTIKSLLSDTGIKEKKVHLGVANQRVVVRQVDLAKLPEDELRRSLPFTAQEHIPMPVEVAELDFHVLEERPAEADGVDMLRVLLVAAQKDMVATHVQTAEAAGLKPVGVDLNPFAMLRALTPGTMFDDEAPRALIDIGAGVTSIVVARGEVPLFVRILVLGGNDVTGAVSAAEGLAFTEAELRKREVGMVGSDPVASAIADRANQFVDEIRSSLDYFRAQSAAGSVDRLVLSGGGSQLKGLPERIRDVIGLPVETARPFDVTPSASGEPREVLELRGPLVTTAVGLALGGLE